MQIKKCHDNALATEMHFVPSESSRFVPYVREAGIAFTVRTFIRNMLPVFGTNQSGTGTSVHEFIYAPKILDYKMATLKYTKTAFIVHIEITIHPWNQYVKFFVFFFYLFIFLFFFKPFLVFSLFTT